MNKIGLSRDQQVFIDNITPYCIAISRWAFAKSYILKKSVTNSLHPVVVLAHIIIESNWGTHPISQPTYGKKPANNLALLEPDHLWQGKILHLFDGREYKSYDNWGEFAADYSDSIAFKGSLSPLVNEKLLSGQLESLAAMKESPTIYKARLEATIETFNLTELFK